MSKLSYVILALSLVSFTAGCAEQKGRKKEDKKADADKKDEKKDDDKAQAKQE